MEGYLGEFDVKIEDTPFKDFAPKDWALYYIGTYGSIDGAHHKLWTLDQVARILNGAPITIKEARWSNGHKEYRHEVGDSKEYRAWVKEVCNGEDGPDTYEYGEGIAP